MKAMYEQVSQSQDPNRQHAIKIEGTAREFELVIEALENHPDERVQKMGSYIRRNVLR